MNGPANARNVAALLSRVWDVRVEAAHLVPHDGPVLLAANHSGLLDGPILVAHSPRPVRTLTKQALFTGVLGRLLSTAGQIPLEYEGPDRSALQEAIRVLGAAQAVGIFPEAHRGRGDVAHVRHGVAYLAARSGAPVVPVAILGTRADWASYDAVPGPRTRIDVVFGEPYAAGAVDARNRQAVAGLAERLRQRLADHVAYACDRTGQQLPAPPPRRAA